MLHIKRKLILLLVTILLLNVNTNAQTKPMFSQYMFNMLTLNPAYAGNRSNINLNALYRRQWIGVPGSPTTWMASVDGRLTSNNSLSFGFQMYDDQLGIEKGTGVQGYYAYHLALSYPEIYASGHEGGTTLSIGMGVGLMNYQANYQQSDPYTSGDPRLATIVNGYTPTAGFGLLLHTYKWYVGLSAPSLLRSKINNENNADVSSLLNYNEVFATAGYVFGKEYALIKVKPSILLKTAQGAPLEWDFNLNAWFNNVFMAGASYRTGDAVVGMLEIQAAQNLRIGYSYDYTTSNLNSYSRGTHEIMLRYEFAGNGNKTVAPVRFY